METANKRKSQFDYFREMDEIIKEEVNTLFIEMDKDERSEEPAELADRYQDDINEAIWHYIDNQVVYYHHAADIVAELGYWNGWKDLDLLGGEAPENISQLAFAVLYQCASDEGIYGGYSWAFEEVQKEYKKLKEELNEAKQ
jgi:hypothetical protein